MPHYVPFNLFLTFSLLGLEKVFISTFRNLHKPFNINWPQIPFSGKDRNLWDDLKELCSAGVFPEASICLILVDEKRRRKAVMWCIQKFMCLGPDLLNGSSYCMRAQTYKSTDRSGKFCGWSTDSAQIKEHRQVFSVKTNAIHHEQLKLVSGLRHAFLGAGNNSANTSKLTGTNISKSHCVSHLNTFLSWS